MAGALRKTMEYLGLAETDEYDAPRAGGSHRMSTDDLGERPDEEWATVDDADEAEGAVRDVHATGEVGLERRPGHGGVVTPLHPRGFAAAPVAQPAPELRRITTIHPRTYNEAKSIGESFRGGVPVIMNLTDMSDADAKRLVDFSAGLVFGLRGTIERVTNKVFLLSPEHVTVTGEAPPARPAHLFNQS